MYIAAAPQENRKVYYTLLVVIYYTQLQLLNMFLIINRTIFTGVQRMLDGLQGTRMLCMVLWLMELLQYW